MPQEQQEEAHRVISPLAAKYAGIEEAYSATDINGKTYKFDIFEDGNYRVSEVIKLKSKSKEVANERNPNTNSRYSMASFEQQRNNSSNDNRSNRNNGTSKQDVKISPSEQEQSQDRISNQTQSRDNRELENSSLSFTPVDKLDSNKDYFFRGQTSGDKNISYNNTNFMGESEGNVYLISVTFKVVK